MKQAHYPHSRHIKKHRSVFSWNGAKDYVYMWHTHHWPCIETIYLLIDTVRTELKPSRQYWNRPDSIETVRTELKPSGWTVLKLAGQNQNRPERIRTVLNWNRLDRIETVRIELKLSGVWHPGPGNSSSWEFFIFLMALEPESKKLVPKKVRMWGPDEENVARIANAVQCHN